MYLFHKYCHHGLDTLVNEWLDMLDCFFFIQIQTELVLYLRQGEGRGKGEGRSKGEGRRGKEERRGKMKQDYIYTRSILLLLTFWTVLSGSRAISGTPASSISENRFRIRFADLHTHTPTHATWKASLKSLFAFLTVSVPGRHCSSAPWTSGTLSWTYLPLLQPGDTETQLIALTARQGHTVTNQEHHMALNVWTGESVAFKNFPLRCSQITTSVLHREVFFIWSVLYWRFNCSGLNGVMISHLCIHVLGLCTSFYAKFLLLLDGLCCMSLWERTSYPSDSWTHL